MVTRLLTAVFLIIMMLIGLGPIPTTSLICLYAVIFRPRWFKKLVDNIYEN